MRFWPTNWGPRTLGAQLIVVTATAVIVSNVAVGLWFEITQESLTEASITERLLDRAASAATLLGGIPAREREAAARTMSSGPWRFELLYGNAIPQPMTDEEARLAGRVRAMLPPERAKQPVSVSLRTGALPPVVGQGRNGARVGPIIEVTLPVVRNTQLVTTFYRPAPPHWPMEIIVAGIVALLTASAATAFIARQVATPLSKLAAAASEAARGSPAPRVPEEGPDDVRKAAHAFNAMTDQVRRTLESHRHLLSAVGHDLRTPITAMFISAEFVEDEEVRERLQKNLEELQDLPRRAARAGSRCARSTSPHWSRVCAPIWTKWASP
jgi:HAMP domain-containing protein